MVDEGVRTDGLVLPQDLEEPCLDPEEGVAPALSLEERVLNRLDDDDGAASGDGREAGMPCSRLAWTIWTEAIDADRQPARPKTESLRGSNGMPCAGCGKDWSLHREQYDRRVEKGLAGVRTCGAKD